MEPWQSLSVLAFDLTYEGLPSLICIYGRQNFGIAAETCLLIEFDLLPSEVSLSGHDSYSPVEVCAS